MFIIEATNDKIWNWQDLIHFLVTNQGKSIELWINPEAICLETLGLYQLLDNFKFSDVTIITENPLESHDRYKVKFPKNRDKNRFFSHRPNIPTSLHMWDGNKIFLAFYHRPTASRLGLASYLFNHYREQSLIHFNYQTDIDRLQLFEFDKLLLMREVSVAEAITLLPHMPMHAYDNPDVDEVMSWYTYDRDPGITMYPKILIDLISESHVIGNTFYPTEKTARAIWLKNHF